MNMFFCIDFNLSATVSPPALPCFCYASYVASLPIICWNSLNMLNSLEDCPGELKPSFVEFV